MSQCSAGIQRFTLIQRLALTQRHALCVIALFGGVLFLSSCSYNKLRDFALENADQIDPETIDDDITDKTQSSILEFVEIIKGGSQAFGGVSGQFARLMLGSDDEIRFKRPIAVGGIDNFLYIVDEDPRVVYIYDLEARKISVLGNIAVHFVGNPGNIYVAQDYSFYIVDVGGKQVLHFSQDGELLTNFKDPANLSRPIDVIVDEVTQEVLVADGSYSHIVVFNQAGIAKTLIGKRGNTVGTFRAITAIARGAAGLYVLDRLEMPIQVLNMQGRFEFAFGESEQVYPTSISISSEQMVFVSDRSDNTIRIYKNRVLIGKVGTGGAAPGRFRLITSLSVVGDLLYVADSGNRRVQVFRIMQQISPAKLDAPSL